MSTSTSTEEINGSVYQTPDAVHIVEERSVGHPELDSTPVQVDLGASPVLGPTTRSGKKRKHVVPVKSSGKKKSKTMMRSPSTKSGDPPSSPAVPTVPVVPADPEPPVNDTDKTVRPAPTRSASCSGPPNSNGPDIVQLLTSCVSDIKNSMSGMESRLGGKIDSLEHTVKNNESKISTLTTDLQSLGRRVDAQEVSLDRRIAEAIRSHVGQAGMDGGGSLLSISTRSDGPLTQNRTPTQVESYWRCRKSLRLWPIAGPDLQRDVESFLGSMLGFDPDYIKNNIGHFSVRRVVEPRSKIQQEVVVEFGSPPVRDIIKSSGFKLEGKRGGIRIELPHFLKSDFHVLQNVAYRLKMGNASMKRSVKFDDELLGLYLDIQLPGQDWRRIRPDQARAARQTEPALRSGPAELSCEMIAGAIRTSAAGGSSSTNESGSPPPRTTPSILTGANATPLS